MKTLVFHIRTVTVAASCAGLALLASACGAGSSGNGSGPVAPKTPESNGVAMKPVAQIVTTADSALESAASVRMHGTVSDSSTRYTVDLTLAPAGAQGSVTAPFEGSKPVKVDLILVGGKMYVRSSTMWREVGGANGAALASLLDGRWVLMPSSVARGFPFADTKSFLDLLNHSGFKNLAKMGAVGVQTTVNGQPAVEIKHSSSALYVATTGQPYPLEIKQGRRNVVVFQYYGTPVTITAPANPVDLSKVRG